MLNPQRLPKSARFPAVVLSGNALSVTLLGKPDAGFVTLTELAQATSYITSAINIPVLVDADTGFGNAINVMRTIEQLIKSGADAIFIEDQVTPKRCGNVAGKEVISLAEAMSKYRAAIEVRNAIDPGVVLVARSDARGVSGGSLADTVERCKAYRNAGVDVVFPEGLPSKQELAEFARELRCPILYNRSGVSPSLSKKELQELGVNFVVNSGVAVRSAARAMWDYLHAYASEDELLEQRLAAELTPTLSGIITPSSVFPSCGGWRNGFFPRRSWSGAMPGLSDFSHSRSSWWLNVSRN